MSLAENVATLPQPRGGNYEFARFNALRHGVLSQHTVLPWEDREQYVTLVEALVAEHKPQGPIEEHLVEELAGVIWRKRRLRLGERAAHHHALRHATDPYQRTAEAALINVAEDVGPDCVVVRLPAELLVPPPLGVVAQRGQCAGISRWGRVRQYPQRLLGHGLIFLEIRSVFGCLVVRGADRVANAPATPRRSRTGAHCIRLTKPSELPGASCNTAGTDSMVGAYRNGSASGAAHRLVPGARSRSATATACISTTRTGSIASSLTARAGGAQRAGRS